ncbi:hypothetical protein ABOONEI_2643 [Aciduliprofundum boonei T469]|nr:hypothetical protein ABOONEI_2643 [Aciduliprofundum boonei T469]
MIKDVLRGIYQGKSIAQIAEELNMEYSALMSMIEHLIKMGYILAADRKPQELGPCKTCPLYKVCSQNGPKIYYLTEKGKRAIK